MIRKVLLFLLFLFPVLPCLAQLGSCGVGGYPASDPCGFGGFTNTAGVVTQAVCLGKDSIKVFSSSPDQYDSITFICLNSTNPIQSFGANYKDTVVFPLSAAISKNSCLDSIPDGYITATIRICFFRSCNGILYTIGSNTEQVYLYANPRPEFLLTDDTVCWGQPVDANLRCYNPGFTSAFNDNVTRYYWDFGDPAVTSDVSNFPNPAPYVYVNPGTYTITCSAANNCDSMSFTKTVVVEPPPDPEIIGDSIFCLGDSVLLTLNAAYDSIRWHNNSSTDSLWVMNNSVMTYVSVYSAQGCVGRDTFPVTAQTPPVVSITANPGLTACTGNTIALAAAGSAGIAYLWSTGATDPSLAVNTSGTYAVTVSWALNSCTATDSVAVVFSGSLSPTVTASAPVICAGSPVTISVDGSYAAYSWSTGEVTDTITVTGAGTYTVVVTDAGNCTGMVSVTVRSAAGPAQPVVTIAPNDFCEGSTALLSLPAGGLACLWNTGDTTDSIAVAAGGVYTVTVTDADGCSATTDTTVLMRSNPLPVLLPASAFCQGSADTLTVTAVPGASYQWSGGTAMANSTVVTAPGVYTVTVTQANGCTRTAATVVIENLISPVLFTGTLSVCQGSTAQIFANGYVKYQWSDGSTANPLLTTTPGTYVLTVTDANNCKTSDSIAVNVYGNPQPIVTVTGTAVPAFCPGDSVLLTLNQSYASIQWSASGDTDTAVYITTGGWIVATVTDTNTCTAADSIFITAHPAPPVPLGDTSGVCSPAVVALQAPVAGSFTYLWSTGATTANISAMVSGSYSVTVTDQSTSCTATGTELVLIHPKPVATIQPPPRTCLGDTVRLSGNAGNFIYNWSPLPDTTRLLAVSSSGTYQLIIEDIHTCRDTESIALTFHPVPSFSIVGDSVICTGDTIGFRSSAAFSAYSWTTPQGTSADSAILVFSGGSYALTVTDTNACTATQIRQLTGIPLPSPVINGDTVTCAGIGTVLNSGYPDLPNVWSTADTTSTIYVYQQGTYTVTITDQYGCTGTDQIYVTVHPLPVFTIAAGNTGPVCAGDTVALTTVPAGFAAYQWSGGSTVSSMNAVTSGNVLATVTDNNGCRNTASYNVVVHPLPVPIITGPDSSCVGDVEQLSVQTGFLSYLWTPTGSTLNAVNVTNGGTYTVAVTDTNYCTADTAVSIVFYPVPVVNITGNSSFCTNDSTVLQVNNPNCTYLWNNGSATPFVTAYTGGTYQVTVTNAQGCSAGAVKQVNQFPLPVPIITGNDTVCAGSPSLLEAGTYQSYLWSNGMTSNTILAAQEGTYVVTVVDTNQCVNSSPPFVLTVLPAVADITASGSLNLCRDQTVTLTASPGASYLWSTGSTAQSIVAGSTQTVIVTVTSPNGCVRVSAPVQVNDRPDPKAGAAVIDSLDCAQGYMVRFIDQSISEPGSVYAWNFGDGNTASEPSPVHYYQQTGNYAATLTIISPYGCTGDTTVLINAVYSPPAIADFTMSTEIASILGDSVEFRSLALNAAAIQWNFNDSKNAIVEQAERVKHAFCNEGDHEPLLIAWNADGCPDTARRKIHISPFFLENTFTPNGDRLNEGFIRFEHPENILRYELKIFSRWSSLIFSTNDPREQWTGEDKNGTQNQGVYVYTLELMNLAGCPVYTNSAPSYDQKVIPLKSAKFIGIVNVIR